MDDYVTSVEQSARAVVLELPAYTLVETPRGCEEAVDLAKRFLSGVNLLVERRQGRENGTHA